MAEPFKYEIVRELSDVLTEAQKQLVVAAQDEVERSSPLPPSSRTQAVHICMTLTDGDREECLRWLLKWFPIANWTWDRKKLTKAIIQSAFLYEKWGGPRGLAKAPAVGTITGAVAKRNDFAKAVLGSAAILADMVPITDTIKEIQKLIKTTCERLNNPQSLAKNNFGEATEEAMLRDSLIGLCAEGRKYHETMLSQYFTLAKAEVLRKSGEAESVSQNGKVKFKRKERQPIIAMQVEGNVTMQNPEQQENPVPEGESES